METILPFEDPLTWIFLLTSIFAVGMIFVRSTGMVLLGVFILLMNSMILQSNLQNESDIRFVYEEFEKGSPIECGLWRGSKTIVDPSKGWVLESGRFVKEDTLISDPQMCSVRDKEFPMYDGLIPALFLLIVTASALFIKLAVQSDSSKRDDIESKEDRHADA